MISWADAEGTPFPLGVSRCGDRYNFALYSKHATAVRLLLFREGELDRPEADIALDPLVHKSGRVWHVRVPAQVVSRCRYYGEKQSSAS